MYGYIPDSLYKLCKDDPQYVEMTNTLKELTIHRSSIEESIYADQNLYNENKDFYMEYRNMLLDMATKYYPDLYIPTSLLYHEKGLSFDIVNQMYTEYVEQRNDLNPEIGMYIIMIAQHSAEGDKEENMKWLRRICHIFESCDKEAKSKMSSYCICKYYLSKMILYTDYLGKNKDPEYLSKVTTMAKDLKEKVYGYMEDTDSNKDLINYKYIQTMDNMIHELITYFGDVKAYKMLEEFSIMKALRYVTHSYMTHLYQYINIYAQVSSIYFFNRDVKKFFYWMSHLYKVTNNAMKDTDTFYNALEFSRDINQYSMLFILRRLVSLEYFFKKFGYELKYISDSDRAFVCLESYDNDTIRAADGLYIIQSDIKFEDARISGIKELLDGLTSYPGEERLHRIFDNKEDIDVFPSLDEILKEAIENEPKQEEN